MKLADILRDPGEAWPYTRAELPAVFGAPANVSHPMSRRIAYGITALLLGITGALGNALVFVNQPQLQGALGLYAYEIAWLPAAYVMAVVPMNLILVKFRKQFGLRLFVIGTVTLYGIVILAHLFARSFASAVAVRAASGMVSVAFFTHSIFYMAQALPMKWRLQAIVFGLGFPQLSVPLARCLFSSELLALGEWQALYLCDLGLGLISLGAVICFTLPAAPRGVTYERLDFVTFALVAGGAAAVSAVAGLGRILWWHDTPWLGYTLAGAIPLIVAALLIERKRTNPLLALKLLVSAPFVRFIVLTMLLQVAITEQTVGAVGLMNTAGLDNDQLHPLFWWVTVGMVTGMGMSSLVLKPEWFDRWVVLDFLIVAVAAIMDAQINNLSRPEQLYVSQFLVGFATTFGLGPLFLSGLRLALPVGEAAFISFLAVYGTISNLGRLGANTAVGSFEIVREKAHSHTMVEHVVPSDPQVVMRLDASSEVYGHLTSDPVLRHAEGSALLSQIATREATVLAYIDVFQLIAIMASLTALGMLAFILYRHFRERQPTTSRP